jgi:hypothetical protein
VRTFTSSSAAVLEVDKGQALLADGSCALGGRLVDDLIR